MKLIFSLVILSYALFEARGYPYPVFTSSGNVDTWSHGDGSRGGMVLSRFHDSYYSRRAVRGGPNTYALRQPDTEFTQHQSNQYHQADRRRQTLLEVNDTPPQQNEVYPNYYPQAAETPAVVPIEATELVEPVEQAQFVPTTVKAIVVPELLEPEIEEALESKAVKKPEAVNKKKQVRPVDEDDDDEDESPNYSKFLKGAFFPMFFGWSGSSGPTAVANAFSTGKGGAAASEATAYGTLRPVERAS